DGVDVVLLWVGELSRELAAGRIRLGVTGTDLVHEKRPRWEQQVEELEPMGFGEADLILAGPQFWIDVDTLEDLDAVSAAFRRT
ncbi:ATP phosphoribosyltransferase catalytic subunit HisG, partial [Tritonibacter sp. SIMBA_163]